MSPSFGSHHERNEIAARLHEQAEVEAGLTDPKSVDLERLAAAFDSSKGMGWSTRLLEQFAWAFKRGGEHS